MSASSTRSAKYSNLKDGMAMMKSIIRGTAVHSTSIAVLWVVLDGVGFRFSEKRHIT
jgi:hypothetical protein